MIAVLRPEQIQAIVSVAEQLEDKGLVGDSRVLRALVSEFVSGPQEVSRPSRRGSSKLRPRRPVTGYETGFCPGDGIEPATFTLSTKRWFRHSGCVRLSRTRRR